MKTLSHVLVITIFTFFCAHGLLSQQCIECHTKVSPGIVADWEASKHKTLGVDCAACHGDQHTTAADIDKVKIPTPETCGQCHEERVKQFKEGKHAMAWAAMNAMPTAHWQPMAMMEGMKGCGGCHKIGLKTESDITELKKDGNGFGLASCDACHTRQSFALLRSTLWSAHGCAALRHIPQPTRPIRQRRSKSG